MPKRNQKRINKTTVELAGPGSQVWDSEVPGFGLRVSSGGARSFVFQYRTRSGEQGKITIGRFPAMTVEEARKIARQHRVAVDMGGNPSQDRRSLREEMSMRQLAAFYCDDYAKSANLRPRTAKDARRLLERFCVPSIGSRKVRDITPNDIRAIHSKAMREAGASQANRLRATLSKMFSIAIDQGMRSDNPCKTVKQYPQDQRWDYLTADHVRRLLAACDASPNQSAAAAVRMLLFTGARVQETLKAEWAHIDLEAGVWTKPSHHTKTKILHRVCLPDPCVVMLRQMRAEDPNGRFVFPGRNPEAPRQDLKRPWTALLEAAGLPHYRLHDLRRTTASFMISSGSDIMTVGRSLGHTQASTTLRYARVFDGVQREGINRAVASMLAA